MSRNRSRTATRLADPAPVFAALGDPIRLRLVSRLCIEGPLSITRLTEGAAITRQAITKHLYALTGAGLVRHHRRGRERICELEPRPLDEPASILTGSLPSGTKPSTVCAPSSRSNPCAKLVS